MKLFSKRIVICKIIKSDSELQSIHVIILTAKGQELDKQQCMSAGADEFMTKSFSPKEVVARVKSILEAV